MSIPVAPNQLEPELERFGHSAFLLTVSDNETSHVAHMAFRFENGSIYCPISKTAARNIENRPRVVVLWPPYETDGYSMIVDADCVIAGEELKVTPTSGALHRPAAPETPNEIDCGSDCAPLGT